MKSGGSGTRGSTPGNYVSQYMGRDDAVERIPPVRLMNTDQFIQRYMARKSATERLDLDIPEIQDEIESADKAGGIAFGYGSVSLSDERFKAASRDIQEQFDKGKTIMETVVSFTEDYLKESGVVSEDFEMTHKGAYKGNVDQLKLRMAIMAGMDNMARDYDDLQYVGCIQVDTRHVHCHLAMVDKGKGNLAPDGTQKGKISSKSKNKFRRGVDNFLDGYSRLKTMTSSLLYDKRNALCYVKRFTHKAMEQQGFSQLLMASLPEDKTKWRAGSNAKDMRRPNALLRGYVLEVLSQPDSGLDAAIESIKRYAGSRRKREGLSRKEYRKLCQNGKESLITDCMNGVYGVMKAVPDSEKVPASAMLTNMVIHERVRVRELGPEYPGQGVGASAPEGSQNGAGGVMDFLAFGTRLRTYKQRLDKHSAASKTFRETGVALRRQTNISSQAKAVVNYIDFEAEYQTRLACKYQNFLNFVPQREDYQEDFEKLLEYKGKLDGLTRMRRDKTMRQMRAKSAEAYGQNVYNSYGGRFMAIAPSVLELRQNLMEARYNKMQRDFASKLFEHGMSLQQNSQTGELRVSDQPLYPFEDVKALDLHHMGFDLSKKPPVAEQYAWQFVQAAHVRQELYNRASEYLEKTGQQDFIKMLPGRDVSMMSEVAESLRQTYGFPEPSKIMREQRASQASRESPDTSPDASPEAGPVPDASAQRVPRTIPLGRSSRHCQASIDLAIRAAVQSTAELEEFE